MAAVHNFRQFFLKPTSTIGFLLLILAIRNSSGNELVDLRQEETTAPPATTTTLKPIDENHIIVDFRTDFSELWETDCVAVKDYHYLWAFGCKQDNEFGVAGSSDSDYWSACDAPKCRVRYTGLKDDMFVSEITLFGFVGGSSKIVVTGQPGLAGTCSNCVPIAFITSNSSTSEYLTTTINNVNPNHRVFNFGIVSANGAVAVLDKFEIKLAKKETGGGGAAGGGEGGDGEDGGNGGGEGDNGGGADSNSAGVVKKSLSFQFLVLFCYFILNTIWSR